MDHRINQVAATQAGFAPMSAAMIGPSLDGIYQQALDLNNRFAEANGRMVKELSRIGGSWPREANDALCGPETDGLLAAINAVLAAMRREATDIEANTQRLSQI